MSLDTVRQRCFSTDILKQMYLKLTDGRIQTPTYKIENNQINIQVMTDGQIQTLTYKIESNQINIQVMTDE